MSKLMKQRFHVPFERCQEREENLNNLTWENCQWRGSFKEQRKPHTIRGKGSFQSPSLPALAFSSASLTSSRGSGRAEQHHAAQTLHRKQKTQPQSASWTNWAQISHKWQREVYCPTSDPVPCSSLQRQSCNFSLWPEQAVGRDRRICSTQCKVLSLSPDVGTRGHSIPARGGLRWLTELRAAFHSSRE